jgi:hypothetical protein
MSDPRSSNRRMYEFSFAFMLLWGLYSVIRDWNDANRLTFTFLSGIAGITLGAVALFVLHRVPAPIKKARKAAANRVVELNKAVYGSEPYEYRMVQPSEFPELDSEFYDRARSWFEAQGFRFLGDRENVTLSRIMPQARTFIRTMVSADGTIFGGAYHVRLQRVRGLPAEARIIEFETELSDGTFVTTSNAPATARTLEVSGIDAERFPGKTSPDELLRTHRERLAGLAESRPPLTATRLKTMEDVISFQRRMQALGAKYKHSIGYLVAHGIVPALCAIAWINWFLFCGISGYLGGDALHTLPSKDGFVLTSHGRPTPVSEPVWVCNLFYTGATLLLTPLVFLGAIASGSLRSRAERAGSKWPLLWFFAIWLFVWEWSIGTDVYRAAADWRQLRQAKAATLKESEQTIGLSMSRASRTRTNNSPACAQRTCAAPAGRSPWPCRTTSSRREHLRPMGRSSQRRIRTRAQPSFANR